MNLELVVFFKHRLLLPCETTQLFLSRSYGNPGVKQKILTLALAGYRWAAALEWWPNTNDLTSWQGYFFGPPICSIYRSIYLSVHLSIYLSVCLSRVYHTHLYLHMLWFSCRVGGWVSWPWPTKADRRRVSKSSSVCNCNNFSVQLSFWHLLDVLSWIIDLWHALSLSGTGLAETAGMAETAEIAEIADIAGVVTVETTQHTAMATTAPAVPMAALVPWSVTGDAAADHLMSPKQPRWQPG